MSKKVLVKKSKLKKLEEFYSLVGSRKSCTYINEKGENCHYLGDDQSKIAILRAMAKLKNKLQKSIETVAVKNDEITRLAIGLKGWKERCIDNTVKEQGGSPFYELTTTAQNPMFDIFGKNGLSPQLSSSGDDLSASELELAKKETEQLKEANKGIIDAFNARGVIIDKVNADLVNVRKQLAAANEISDGKGQQIVRLFNQNSELFSEGKKKDATIKAQNLTIDSLDSDLKSALKHVESRNDENHALSISCVDVAEKLRNADGVMLQILERNNSWATFFKSFTLTSIREYMKTDAGAGLKFLFESGE